MARMRLLVALVAGLAVVLGSSGAAVTAAPPVVTKPAPAVRCTIP